MHLPEAAGRYPPAPAGGVLYRHAGATDLPAAAIGRGDGDVHGAVPVAHHLDRAARRPSLRQHVRQRAGHRQRAVRQRNHPRAAVGVQPGPTVRVHRELHPGPPAEQAPVRSTPARAAPVRGATIRGATIRGVTGQRLDAHRHVQPRDPGQRVPHHRGLERSLRRRRGVLPVAPAATARPGDRARRRHPLGRYGQDLHGVGPAVRPAILGDPGHHPLPRQRMPHEHHPAVRPTSHAEPAVPDRPDGQLDQLVHGALTATACGCRSAPPARPRCPARAAPTPARTPRAPAPRPRTAAATARWSPSRRG